MKKILIIEDEDSLRKALVARFQMEELEVLEATNGEDGLVSIEEHGPDMILLDIIMPKMDGITMLKKLRTTDFGKDVPVLIMTNVDDAKSLYEGIANGAFDFLIKSNWGIGDMVKKVKNKLAE
ncbi:MAG: response regulator [Parcubacteria group bacterium]|jgi:DNA-binding response OmpR family regulator